MVNPPPRSRTVPLMSKEDIWTDIVEDRVSKETALAMYERLTGHAITADSDPDDDVAWLNGATEFTEAVLKLAGTRSAEEKVVLALLVDDGKLDEAVDRFEAIVARPSPEAVERLRTMAHLFAHIRPRVAAGAYERILKRDGDDADARLGLAALLEKAGDVTAAERHYRGALAIAGLHDGARLDALRSLADIENKRGDLAAAAEHYRATLELYERLSDDEGLADALWLLGENYLQQERPVDARPVLERALDLERKLGDYTSAAFTLWMLSNIARQNGKLGQAEELLENAVDLAAKDEDHELAGDLWSELAELARARKDYHRVKACCLHAIEHLQNAGADGKLGQCLLGLTSASMEAGDHETAQQSGELARRAFDHLGNRTGIAAALLTLAQDDMKRRDDASAEPRLLQAQAIYSDLGAQQKSALVLGLLGDIALRRGDVDAARESWMKSLARLTNAGERDSEFGRALMKALASTTPP